jgi:hypothetical protein
VSALLEGLESTYTSSMERLCYCHSLYFEVKHGIAMQLNHGDKLRQITMQEAVNLQQKVTLLPVLVLVRVREVRARREVKEGYQLRRCVQRRNRKVCSGFWYR